MENFNWGGSPEEFNKLIHKEIFEDKLYEKFFTVEEGDIVMDFGSSVGPFTYSILDNKPKHVSNECTKFFSTFLNGALISDYPSAVSRWRR